MNYYDLMNEQSMYISSSRENSKTQKRFHRPSLPVHYNEVENTWLHHPSTKKNCMWHLNGEISTKAVLATFEIP